MTIMRNCLNISPSDLKNAIKGNLDARLIKKLLGITCCKNSSLINALSMFPEFSLFCASNMFNAIDGDNSVGGLSSSSDFMDYFDSELEDWLDIFNRRAESGNTSGLSNITSRYSGTSDTFSGFPSGLDQSSKDGILGLIQGSDYGNIGGTDLAASNLSKLNSYVGSGNGNGDDSSGDGLFNGTNLLNKIPDDTISGAAGVDAHKFRCFKKSFDVEQYITNELINQPLITSEKVANLRRIHEEILTPIFDYYFPDESDSTCQIKINNGLTSVFAARVGPIAAMLSKHVTGMAVDFSIIGKEATTIAKDITEGRIRIEYGMMYVMNGLHITLPYTFEEYEIKNMFVSAENDDGRMVGLDFT